MYTFISDTNKYKSFTIAFFVMSKFWLQFPHILMWILCVVMTYFFKNIFEVRLLKILIQFIRIKVQIKL